MFKYHQENIPSSTTDVERTKQVLLIFLAVITQF